MTPDPQAVDLLLRGMLLALLALAGLVLWRDRPRLPAARLGAALMAGLCVQVAGSTPAVEAGLPAAWQAPLVGVAVANAPLFWLFVRALFDDGFRPGAAHAGIWLAAALLGGLNCALLAPGGGVPAQLGLVLQRAVPLVAALGCVWAAARHWRDDLVEDRLQLRRVLLVAGVAYTLVMAGVRIGAAQGRLQGWLATLDMALLLAVCLATLPRLLVLRPSQLFPAASAPPDDAPAARAPALDGLDGVRPGDGADEGTDAAADDHVDDGLQARLTEAMQVQRAYRDEGLTLGALAARLGAPEYRLRRHINHRLGHRNFSAYVNGLRLAEARALLADPARREQAVLDIALEVGFGSIGPFNRAFKATTGLTPTEYRRQGPQPLADS